MKFLKLYKELILPAGLLATLIIGAGMFALPYMFVSAGFLVGLFYLAVFTVVFSAIHLMYAEILEKTPGNHGFVGLSKIYLGERASLVSLLTTAIGMILVLTIFIVLSVSFTKLICPSVSPIAAPFVFWALGTIPLFLKIKKVANIDFLAIIGMVVIIFMVFIYGIISPTFSFSGIVAVNLGNFFLPYGIILFSFSGRAAISSIREYFIKNNINSDNFSKAVILGTAFPAFMYLFFILGVIGLSPAGVSKDSVSGLISLPYFMVVAIGILGALSLWTTYVFLSRDEWNILHYDLNISNAKAKFLIVFLPLVFYFASSQDLIKLLSISGGVFLAIECAIVVLMWQKLKNGRHYLGYPLIIIFALGALYELLKIF